MPTVYLAPTYGAGWQGLDASGNPLNAGKLYTYQANSTTPLATYTTSVGSVQNANPIVLNSDGRPPSEIWFIANNSYKLVLTDAAGNTIETRDNLPGINDFSAIQNGSIFLLGNVAGTNTITATGSPTVTSLTAGQLFVLTPAATTTSTGTLQVDSTSAKNVFAYGAIATGGELKIAVPTLVEYDGTQMNVITPQPIVGTFTGTLGGVSTSVTGTIRYTKIGDLVNLNVPAFSGPSNSTAKVISGMVSSLFPAANKIGFTQVNDNGGGTVVGSLSVSSGAINVFATAANGNWTNTGTAIISIFQLSYTTA